MHICVLNGALWNMEQVHSGISELGQFELCQTTTNTALSVIALRKLTRQQQSNQRIADLPNSPEHGFYYL